MTKRARFISLDEARTRHDRLVVDTNVLIDGYKAVVHGFVPPVELPRRAALAVCVYSLYEFLHGSGGALLGPSERRDRKDWLNDRRIGRLYPTADAARTFEGMLHVEECPAGVVDAMIAAACLTERLPLLTNNVSDFEDVPGLLLVDT